MQVIRLARAGGSAASLTGFSELCAVHSPAALWELLAPQTPALLLLEESAVPGPLDAFLAEVRTRHPRCRTVILTENTDLNPVLPYIWQHRADGFYFLAGERPPNAAGGSAEMLRDILSMEYVHDLIYGHMGRLGEVKALFLGAGIDIHPQIVMTVIIDDFWSLCEHLHNRGRYDMKRRLLNSARRAIEQHGITGVATTLIGTDKVVVVMNCGDRTGEAAESYSLDCAKQIKRAVTADTGYSISIGLSHFCAQPSFLWRAYEQSFRALRGAFHQGKNKVLRYREPPAPQADWPQREYVKHELVVGISKNDPARCESAVNELLNTLVVQNQDEVGIKSLVVVLLSELSGYALQIGLDSGAISAGIIRLVGTVFGLTTVGDIQAAVLQYLRDMMQQVHGAQGAGNFPRIAKAYIDQYCSSDLTLQAVAGVCGYSPSHFSRSFKGQCGQTFVQYLTQVRVEKAKALLRSSDIPVSGVAERTGFQSMSYFSSTFKRETGFSPAQYRAEGAPGGERE